MRTLLVWYGEDSHIYVQYKYDLGKNHRLCGIGYSKRFLNLYRGKNSWTWLSYVNQPVKNEKDVFNYHIHAIRNQSAAIVGKVQTDGNSKHNKTFMLTFKSYQIKVMRNSLACILLWIWFSPLNPLKQINTAHPRETNCDSPFAVQHYIYCQGLQPWPRALDLHWGPQEYGYLQARFLGFPEHALFLVSPAYRSFVRHL